MKHTGVSLSVVVAGAVFISACGGNGGSMMGPNAMGMGSPGAALMSVTPQGGATGVPVSAPLVLRFGSVMGVGMEQYVDLHLGDLAGPVIALTCGWSADRMTLTCTPTGALSPHTTYVLHVGGGMLTQAGQALDYMQYGPMMGGQWIMGGMMGASHGGGAWGQMGSGWHNANGGYGMAFTFTTA